MKVVYAKYNVADHDRAINTAGKFVPDIKLTPTPSTAQVSDKINTSKVYTKLICPSSAYDVYSLVQHDLII